MDKKTDSMNSKTSERFKTERGEISKESVIGNDPEICMREPNRRCLVVV